MEEYCLWLQNHVYCTLETPKYLRLSDGLRDLKKKWHKYKNAYGWNIYLFLANPDRSDMPQEYLRDYFPSILWKITGAELDAAMELCRIMDLPDSTSSIAGLLERKLIFFEENDEEAENRNVCMLNSSREKISVSSANLKPDGPVRELQMGQLSGKYMLISAYINMKTGKVVGKPIVRGYEDAFEGMKAMDRLWWAHPLYWRNDEGEPIRECMYRASLSYFYSSKDAEDSYKVKQTEEWICWMVTAAEYILLEAGLTMNAETVIIGLMNGNIFHIIPPDPKAPKGKREKRIEAELYGKKYSCSINKGLALRNTFGTKEEMRNGWERFEAAWKEPD